MEKQNQINTNLDSDIFPFISVECTYSKAKWLGLYIHMYSIYIYIKDILKNKEKQFIRKSIYIFFIYLHYAVVFSCVTE